jgi:hypothetical protein
VNKVITKDTIARDYQRYQDSPEALMVPHGLAGKLPHTRNMNTAPQKMFEDDGHKISVSQYLLARASVTKAPRTAEETWARMEEFLEFCSDWAVPPTISGFSLWNGITLARFDHIGRDKDKPERAEAINLCKEMIRHFLEMSALDSTLNPILFFHMHKVFFGAVEQQSVKVEVVDNSREVSPEEMQARVISLVEGDDGVWGVPE